MIFDRPVLFVDCETTGKDPVKDRIIEIGVALLLPNGEQLHRGWNKRFCPGIPIPAAATAVHGITDADVADCPPFSTYAPKFSVSLSSYDLAGYNLRQYDLPIIDEELRRCGFKLDLTGRRVYDVKVIFFKKNPRTLADCVRFYCGREPTEAHASSGDAIDSMDALLGQIAKHEDLAGMTPVELDSFCLMHDEGKAPADIAGKLYRDDQGDVRYAFGKHVDMRVLDEPSFADWALRSDFPGSTKDVLRAELAKLDDASTNRQRGRGHR